MLPAFAVITPLPSIVIEVPSTLTPPNMVVLAVGNVYAPALALRTPLASIVKLLPILIPPRTDGLAVGNVYALGMLGLLSICAKPDVAFQSDWTGAVLLIVILLLALSQATSVPVSYTHLTLPTIYSV